MFAKKLDNSRFLLSPFSGEEGFVEVDLDEVLESASLVGMTPVLTKKLAGRVFGCGHAAPIEGDWKLVIEDIRKAESEMVLEASMAKIAVARKEDRARFERGRIAHKAAISRLTYEKAAG